MSFASAAILADQSYTSSPPLAASAPVSEMTMAAKRCRFSILPIGELALAEVQLRTAVKKTDPEGLPMMFPADSNRNSLLLNLTPTGSLLIKYGFDTRGKYERPSFLGGPPSNGKSESLGIKVTLADEALEAVKGLDARCRELFFAQPNTVGVQWQPLVSNEDAAKISIVLAGDDCTHIAVLDGDQLTQGRGWNFLSPLLRKYGWFNDAAAKIAFKVGQIWVVDGKAGIRLIALHLRMQASEVAETEDPFADSEF